MSNIELLKSVELISPHTYSVTYQDGTKRKIRMVWAKTQPILEIITGLGAEVKDALLFLMDGDKKAALESAVATISKDMIGNFFAEANRIACIALDEYDDTGKLVRVGDTSVMLPEDVFAVMSMVLADIVELLKNVLGPTPKPKKKK